MTSATIHLDNNVQEISVISHCNGEDNTLATCHSNKENELFSDTQTDTNSLAPNDVMSLVFAKVFEFIDSLPES
jgi:hypothetical protein